MENGVLPNSLDQGVHSAGSKTHGDAWDFERGDFKESFKAFKLMRQPSLNFLKSIKKFPGPLAFLREPGDHVRWVERKAFIDTEFSELDSPDLGLRPIKDWSIRELVDCPGAIVVNDALTSAGQQTWIRQALINYPPRSEFVSNLDPEWKSTWKHRSEYDWWNEEETNAATPIERSLMWKLRWVTLGFHHDWNTKLYSDEKRAEFPEDVAKLCRVVARAVGFEDFSPEAAIVNYYHLNSTLSPHQDVSEPYQEAPLISLSLGQSAIFLIGPTKSQTPIPVVLQSGDFIIMSGSCRLHYHAVPKVFADMHTVPWFPKDRHEPLNAKMNEYLKQSRINYNIRQVLRPGQNKLDDK